MKEKASASKWSVISGLIWRFSERFAAQGVSFVVSLVLARILLPEAYGIVSVAKVFLVVIKAVIYNGLGNSLVQKKNADQLDFSSVFYFQIALGLLLYAGLFLIAPLLAGWYDEPLLTPVFRVMALTLPIGAVNCVQQAFVSRGMQFKRFFFSTIIGTALSAGVGLVLAVMGKGVWALVWQELSNLICDTAILWFTVKWRPSRCFSFARLKGLISYGWKLLLTTMLDNLYNSLYPILIGKRFGTVQQGYYDRGDIIPNVITSNAVSSMQSVLFSAFSKEQSNLARLNAMQRRCVKTTAFLFFPLMFGIAAAAKPLTLLLLTDKWLDSVIFLQYCSFFFAFAPIHAINQLAISAMGRSDVSLRVEILKKGLGLALFLLSLPFGIHALLFAKALSSVLILFINAVPCKRLLGYGYREQARDLLPAFCLAATMAAAVWCVTLLGFGNLPTLFLQVFGGILFYYLGARLFRFESLPYLKKQGKALLRKLLHRAG